MNDLFLRFPPLAGYSETQLARTRETPAWKCLQQCLTVTPIARS
jgi:hypothetical protein